MKVKLLCPNARIPTKGTEDSAGYDLYAALNESIIIHEGETKLIPTGIAIEIPKGYFGAIFPRSGLAAKRGLRLANCVAVIDSDYRGMVQVPLHKDTTKESIMTANIFMSMGNSDTIQNGDRIAQLVILPYYSPELEIVEELSETERGNGGFGSTGVQFNDILDGLRARPFYFQSKSKIFSIMLLEIRNGGFYMKCWICGAEMINTFGGNYHCPKCKCAAINDCIFRMPAIIKDEPSLKGDLSNENSSNRCINQEQWYCNIL